MKACAAHWSAMPADQKKATTNKQFSNSPRAARKNQSSHQRVIEADADALAVHATFLHHVAPKTAERKLAPGQIEFERTCEGARRGRSLSEA
jgi:hypothetical protein